LETTATPLAKHHPGATLALVDFSDFQCEFCAKYTRDVYPTILHDLVDTGIADYIFRHFPLDDIHPLAFMASEAVECAGEQGHYWTMHDKLFADRQRLESEGLIADARAIELNETAFRECLYSGRISARIQNDKTEGKRLGVNATPTLFIGLINRNGKIKLARKFVGPQLYSTIKSAIDELLQPNAKKQY
jgi:protein-disulfide isomerase